MIQNQWDLFNKEANPRDFCVHVARVIRNIRNKEADTKHQLSSLLREHLYGWLDENAVKYKNFKIKNCDDLWHNFHYKFNEGLFWARFIKDQNPNINPNYDFAGGIALFSPPGDFSHVIFGIWNYKRKRFYSLYEHDYVEKEMYRICKERSRSKELV